MHDKRGADIVCWSHLRWRSTFQRPQQLMTRWAQRQRVLFIEEPVIDEDPDTNPRLVIRREAGVVVVEPHLPAGLGAQRCATETKALITSLCRAERIDTPIAWFCAPIFAGVGDAVGDVARELNATILVYDCLDEGVLHEDERELLNEADVVFVAAHAVHEVKRTQHGNVHLVPDGVDSASWDQRFAEMRHVVDDALRAWPLQHLLQSLGA
ncbi:MAG: hypothetical protein Q8O67_19650 [Deltaproteobacteria bacterium]|nr:hypothetical protein [Deltaproteobacteria bacterium]